MTTFHKWGRAVLLASLLLLVMGTAVAQDEDATSNFADSPAIVTQSGTPDSLCEAATPQTPGTTQFAAAEQVLEEGVDYRAIFCTGAGAIYLDLYEDQAPITVNNLVFLAYNGYYDSTVFHRVIEGFMAQGGDPTGTGGGGPGYQFEDELAWYLYFDQPGLLAMANANQPQQGIVGTNGSQFFITTVPTPHLDYNHTIFGEVLEGQENVESFQVTQAADGTPVEGVPTTLETVRIVKDPSLVETTHEDAPAPTQIDVETALSEDNVIATAVALFGSNFPVDEVAVEQQSFTPAEAVDSAPNSVRTALNTFLDEQGIEYIVSSTMTAVNCNLEVIPFISIGYTVYALPLAENADAALADPTLASLGVANGQTQVSEFVFDDRPVYTGSLTACDIETTAGRTFFTHGRYLIEAETVIPSDVQFTPGIIIERLGAIIFDRALADVLRAEIRAE